MNKYLRVAGIVALVLALALLAGCEDGTANGGNGGADEIKVGNVDADGFTYTAIDSGGGWVAEKTVGSQKYVKISGALKDAANLDWKKANIYYLQDTVFVGDDTAAGKATLKIEAGTEIRGLSGITPGLLVVTRHSKINAVGTAADPIVFTSARQPGGRSHGDWGGIVINGRAPINPSTPGEAEGEGNSGTYGGGSSPVANDDSGTLKYVRVEYAGRVFTSDDELNGIAFQGVGSGTTVEYVQVHQNSDDGIEFFGGTVNAKYLVVTGCDDDSLDWTDGWVGKVQFAVVQHYPSPTGDQGIEADNNGDDTDATPYSNPTLANLTLVGAGDNSDIGMLFRAGTKVSLYNTYVGGFEDGGLDVDDKETWDNYTDLNFDGVVIDNGTYDTFVEDDEDINGDGTKADPQDMATAVFDTTENDTTAAGSLPSGATATDLGDGTWSFDMVPTAELGSAGLANSDLASVDSFFTDADYVGAIEPGGTDWTDGWITTAKN